MTPEIDYLPDRAVLLLIDLQQAIDDPSWGPRSTPCLERNVARLLDSWRSTRRPIVHIRHCDRDPASTFRPDQPLAAFKPEAAPLPRETVLEKHRGSAFHGTELKQRLRREGLNCLVVAGVLTNYAVDATVRSAKLYGFDSYVVSDATAAVDKALLDGRIVPAEEVQAFWLANLHGTYGTVISTETVLRAIQ